MEIERINENTVKFYISYVDIEDRGFEREEIWYNRERSEQLFWQMMDEVNYKEEDFSVEGPLWIQVQALEKGLEIIVTKAQISKGGNPVESLDDMEDTIDITINDKAKQILDGKSGNKDAGNNEEEEVFDDDSNLWMTASFRDLEDVIQLSHYFQEENEPELITVLYYYNDKYYIYVELAPTLFDLQEDILSKILEYSNEAEVTYHVLDEYGKIIFEDNVFAQVRKYFPSKR
jgi:adapter protein MecA 1/2